MADAPYSRSASRSGTPAPAPPSRLSLPPALHQSPSLSNLHIHSHNTPPFDSSELNQFTIPTASVDHTALNSSASSVVDMEPAEGFILQDNETDIEHTDVEEHTAARSDETKNALRDQLRSLTQKVTHSDVEGARARQDGKDVETVTLSAVSTYPPREYYVLTDAGKPVYISRPGGGDQDSMASTIGIMQALISVFLDDNDKLRCINAGRTRITFVLRSPLYYACVSAWGEPESVTRSHLEYLHLQILSIVTGSQLKRIFEKRTNFDLRRLLNGAEPFMNSMLVRLELDMAMSMSALHCLKMEPVLRKRIAETLVPNPKMKDMLYIILIANSRVVTLIRPRKHSIHPADLHIILNTIHSPSIYNSPANASWIPVCLPKFNPSGFVNAYITFLRRDDSVQLADSSALSRSHSPNQTTPTETTSVQPDSQEGLNETGIALVCVSSGGDLDVIRTWCDKVIKKLMSDGTLNSLIEYHLHKETDYSVSELGIPGLRHFIYKSRTQVQITLPTFEDPYDQPHNRKRLTILYQTLYDSIHAKSGQESGLKLQYIRTETESVMGWITQPFELYVALSPLLPKSAAVGAANAVARWVKKEEGRLFLRDAPVF